MLCIAGAADGLAQLCRFYPERRAELAQLPELVALCQRFVVLMEGPKQLGRYGEAWAQVLRACGQLGCNPPVGTGARRLFDVLLAQLPDASLSPFDSANVLRGLALSYGVPHGGQLAPALQPCRALLAQLGKRGQAGGGLPGKDYC